MVVGTGRAATTRRVSTMTRTFAEKWWLREDASVFWSRSGIERAVHDRQPVDRFLRGRTGCSASSDPSRWTTRPRSPAKR